MCAGPSWGSTTSEASTEAVRLACKQLVATLKPHFAEAGENATWQEVILKVHPEVGFNASKARDCLYLFPYKMCLATSPECLRPRHANAGMRPLRVSRFTCSNTCAMPHCVHRLLIAADLNLRRRTPCFR